MWTIYEHRDLTKRLLNSPKEILKRYQKWKDIVEISGPAGLRMIKGFHDESLKGQWRGYRSSRLGLQYRVIYKIVNESLLVQVMDVNPHDYKRK